VPIGCEVPYTSLDLRGPQSRARRVDCRCPAIPAPDRSRAAVSPTWSRHVDLEQRPNTALAWRRKTSAPVSSASRQAVRARSRTSALEEHGNVVARVDQPPQGTCLPERLNCSRNRPPHSSLCVTQHLRSGGHRKAPGEHPCCGETRRALSAPQQAMTLSIQRLAQRLGCRRKARARAAVGSMRKAFVAVGAYASPPRGGGAPAPALAVECGQPASSIASGRPSCPRAVVNRRRRRLCEASI
jgi:hypothetical protein